MADGVQVSRSTQLVSLDTHPANNALVVTYEILVSIVDAASQRELSRRNKRAQLQIHIRQLDQLEERDFRAGKIDLGRISSEIIQRCPLLLSSGSNFNLEDIQLHLLYLINRRQSSLLMRNQDRPPSSASISRSGRLHSAAYAAKQTGRAAEFAGSDIYTYIRLLEARNRACCFDFQGFELRFNERLDSIEATHQDVAIQIKSLSTQTTTIDRLLEGLYGDRNERFLSLAALRRMCVSEDESRLADIGSNRLLTCAMVRILRDSSADEYCAREFILCCLIRISSYQDIYLGSFEHPDTSIDLIRVLCDLLAEHLKLHQKESTRQEEPLASVLGSNSSSSNNNTHSDCSYDYLGAILVVFLNLSKISKNQDGSTSIRFEERMMSQDSANILSDLFQLNARDLMREIRLMGKPAKVIQLLQANILLLRQLSCMREFIQRVRVKNNQFLESMVTLLNCLQLSRPGSGGGGVASNASSQSPILIRDEQTLSELYHLELNLLMLVNNLLMDSRIRTKLIKRKLLKPVLRNLVIFLAVAGNSLLDSSGGGCSNSSVSSSRSLIMLAPFRSLYELSCDKSVRLELYKSKIIMKCLLEYLLSSLANYPSAHLNRAAAAGKFDWLAAAAAADCAIIEPNNVSHYILSVWINLSSLAEGPIYSKQSCDDDDGDLELRDLINEYVDLVLDKLLKLRSHDDEILYLHLKLLRNLSQFSSFNTQDQELELYQRCLNRTSELAVVLFDSRQSLKPYLVECLATLANLVAAKPTNAAAEEEEEEEQEIPQTLAVALSKLLQLKCENFHGEEDDDLLLVAIQLIGNLANKFELCHDAAAAAINQEAPQQPADGIYAKVLRACNFVLSSKLTDYELIIHTLYSLSQLMNHAQFLKSLLAASPANLHDEHQQQQQDGNDSVHAMSRINDIGQPDQDEQDSGGSNLSMSAELLANKLANLVLCHTDSSYRPTAGEQQQSVEAAAAAACPLQGAQVIPRLALELLNIFRQLEQQTSIECSFVHKIRFAQYNSKWLAAIQASREALESPTSPAAAAATATRNGQVGSRPPEAGWFGGGKSSELLFDQSVGASVADDDDEDEDEDEDICGRPLPAMPEEAEEDEDENKLDNSEGSSGDSNFSEAPDLNVIDPKSMIKHLSSRRQLRQMQQQQQQH